MFTTAGDMAYATAANALARLAIGAAGSILKSDGSAPAWLGIGTASQVLKVVGGLPAWAGLMEMCVVYRGSNQAFNSGAAGNILWDSDLVDPSDWHSTSGSTDRITVAENGYYVPFVSIYFNKNTGGTGNFHVTGRVQLNGVDTANKQTYYEAIDAVSKLFVFGGIPVYMTAGQYLTVNFLQDSGGAGNIIGGGADKASFAVLRVG